MNRKRTKITEQLIEDIIKLYCSAKKPFAREVGRALSINPETVLSILRKNGIEIRQKKTPKFTEEEVIDLYVNKQMFSRAIGEKLNIPFETVNVILRRHKIERNKISRINLKKTSEIEQQVIVKHIDEKLFPHKIGKLLNISPKTVVAILKRNNVPISPYEKSEEIKTLICDLYNSGLGFREIGEQVDVSSTFITKTLNGNNIEIRNNHIEFSEEEEINIVKMYCEETKSVLQISVKFNCSSYFINNVLEKNGITIRERVSYKDKENEVIDMYVNKTLPALTISNALNIPNTTIGRILAKNNIKKRPISQSKLGLTDEEYKLYILSLPEQKKYRQKVITLTVRQDVRHLPFYEKRGRSGLAGAYQLDHRYSILEGFINNVPEETIANINNLEFIPWQENREKSKKCSVTLEELYSKINNK